MINFQKKFATSRYIYDLQTGCVISKPSVRVCRLEYNINEYHDSLFSDFYIPLLKHFSAMAMKRRAEYLAGRIAVQTLLREQNVNAAVTSCSDRSPEWPSGWQGSISHTDRYAIAIVAPSERHLVLGVDIEEDNPRALLETAPLFINDVEKRLLSKSPLIYPAALLIAFSAKESLFKALYPKVRKMFDFDAAEIKEIDVMAQTFILRLACSLSAELTAGLRIIGRYQFYKGNVITLIAEELPR